MTTPITEIEQNPAPAAVLRQQDAGAAEELYGLPVDTAVLSSDHNGV